MDCYASFVRKRRGTTTTAHFTPTTSSTNTLSVVAGVLGLGGTLVLLIQSDYERLPKKYRLLEEATERNLESKVTTGEGYLASLASKARIARFWQGGASLAVGAGTLAAYLAGDRSTERSPLIYTGIIYLGYGVTHLLVKRRPEKEYDKYNEWKKSWSASWLSPVIGIVPLHRGGLLAVSWEIP